MRIEILSFNTWFGIEMCCDDGRRICFQNVNNVVNNHDMVRSPKMETLINIYNFYLFHDPEWM